MYKRSYGEAFNRFFVSGTIVTGNLITIPTIFISPSVFRATIPFGIVIGILFGLFWGSIMAFFHRGLTITLTFQNKEDLINKINFALKAMKYHLASEENNVLTYSSTKRVEFYRGDIFIEFNNNSVTITGAYIFVKRLLQKITPQNETRIVIVNGVSE